MNPGAFVFDVHFELDIVASSVGPLVPVARLVYPASRQALACRAKAAVEHLIIKMSDSSEEEAVVFPRCRMVRGSETASAAGSNEGLVLDPFTGTMVTPRRAGFIRAVYNERARMALSPSPASTKAHVYNPATYSSTPSPSGNPQDADGSMPSRPYRPRLYTQAVLPLAQN